MKITHKMTHKMTVNILVELRDVVKRVPAVSLPGVIGEMYVVGAGNKHQQAKDKDRPRPIGILQQQTHDIS